MLGERQSNSFVFKHLNSIFRMRLSTFLFSSLLSLTVSAAPQGSSKVPEFFSQRVVFTPPSNYTDPRTLYARTAEFENGVYHSPLPLSSQGKPSLPGKNEQI